MARLLCVGLLLLAGCIEQQEIRLQRCAHLAVRQHGYSPPDGAYGAWARGERCYTKLWNGTVVREHDLGVAVFDLGPDRDHTNGFSCLGKCHRENLYDVKISADQRWCYCRDDKVSD